jgi:hypothetical protein
MKEGKYIWMALLVLGCLQGIAAMSQVRSVAFDCFGDSLTYVFPQPLVIDRSGPIDGAGIETYCRNIPEKELEGLVASIKSFRDNHQLDDWLYYQLVRRVADQISPKSSDYQLYTIYKWYLLTRSGYDAILTFAGGKLLFYVRSDENIYNIPIRREVDRNYVCLNYHDYGFNIDFSQLRFRKLDLPYIDSGAFSYRVNSMPGTRGRTVEKELNFVYNRTNYRFRIKLNPNVAAYFRNYPVTDYEKHFNIPLSPETYASLIPALRRNLKGLSARDGIDFLMHFTRYAFLFRTDADKYGSEKVYSPEMTLFNESSDCEDRVGLFYFLVKEIYDLPMVVLTYPKHVSIAVHFDKSFGQTVEYNGKKFTICEPTPQADELSVGQAIPSLSGAAYHIAFAYEPHSVIRGR